MERNAEIFFARFGGHGDEASTLQAVGNRFEMTRERVRQIVEKQLEHLSHAPIRTDCFDQLEEACRRLDAQPIEAAEGVLRPLLGRTLGLIGALDYGIEILGRRLPLHIVSRKDSTPFVVPGDYPDWIDTAVTHSKRLIRHSGAAQFTLAWALTCRDIGSFLDPDEYRRVVQMLPGFDWIDERETWYWLGHDGSANRILARTIEILAAAAAPLDVEIIYGGLSRFSRNRESDVAAEAGVFPPIEIVHGILSRSPCLKCQQGDDFRLLLSPDELKSKEGVAEAVVEALRARSGLASRSELYDAVVTSGGVNAVSFSVALAISPLIRQVDRGVFAIRGWPISAPRLQEAQRSVGGGERGRTVEVEISDDGCVSWIASITEGALANRQTTLPAMAARHLPPGQYRVEGMPRIVTVHPDRIQGVVGALVKGGAVAGSDFRVTFHAGRRVVRLESLSED
ncbi:hypothetical protein GCM10027191_20080 [Novilysobacter erysipheiresistens]